MVLDVARGDAGMLAQDTRALDLEGLYRESNVGDALEALDRELIGLAPVKHRVHEIAALLLVEKLRRSTFCGCRAASSRVNTGAKQTSVPSSSRHHSS